MGSARRRTGSRTSDDEILAAQRYLARREGVFCEAASAASVAGLLKMSREGHSLTGKTAVCVITGTGLKEPELAPSLMDTPAQEVEAELDAVERALALGDVSTTTKQR